MKTLKISAVVAVMMLTAAVSAGAQQAQRLTFTVPFSFSVENKVLPAGSYSISPLSATSSVIRSNTGSAAAVFVSIPTKGNTGRVNPELVFERHGDTNILRTIWEAGTDAGLEIPGNRSY